MESHSSGLEKESIEEEYLSHGSIVMQRMKIGKSLSRVIHVRKMRMTAADDQPRPYKIDETGINVYDKEALF
jgi:KaiC/GvpD/RAD55 family RecA-like ATPase